MSAQEVIGWALKKFGSKVALASSFGAEDVVLIDMMVKIDPKARIFSLDTGRLNPETYDVMDKIRDKYKITIEVMFPQSESVEKMVRAKGMNLFYDSIENRKECCSVRKVEPLNRALSKLEAWITGLRRQQAVTRTTVPKVEVDSAHNNMAKINPIADWTSEQVWAYIKKNGVPYNILHDKGYPSIGCAPCTRPVKPGEDERAGRWWWENPETKECGLHVKK
ncbi:MAG: phosphoadenylyl-sulfate reductase [Deltaproteobacteria bacterium]|nr:phosphoadenylyl-sulfate reductase [Deltaproteobacteria bacterium]